MNVIEYFWTILFVTNAQTFRIEWMRLICSIVQVTYKSMSNILTRIYLKKNCSAYAMIMSGWSPLQWKQHKHKPVCKSGLGSFCCYHSAVQHLSRTSIEDDSHHKIDPNYYIDSDLLFTTIQFKRKKIDRIESDRFNQGLIRETFNEFVNFVRQRNCGIYASLILFVKRYR